MKVDPTDLFATNDLYDLYALDAYCRDDDYRALLISIHDRYRHEMATVMSNTYNKPRGRLWTEIIPKQLRALAFADPMTYVDGINQLVHYHGMLVDYFSGQYIGDNIGDILDRIFVARTPTEFWEKLSKRVRRKCWVYTHGIDRGLGVSSRDLIIPKLRRVETIQKINRSGNGVTGYYRRPYFVSGGDMRVELSRLLSFKINCMPDGTYCTAWEDLASQCLNEGDEPIVVFKATKVQAGVDYAHMMFAFNYGDMVAHADRTQMAYQQTKCIGKHPEGMDSL